MTRVRISGVAEEDLTSGRDGLEQPDLRSDENPRANRAAVRFAVHGGAAAAEQIRAYELRCAGRPMASDRSRLLGLMININKNINKNYKALKNKNKLKEWDVSVKL